MTHLTSLSVTENRLTYLPNEIFNLKKLESLSIYENPIVFSGYFKLDGVHINLFYTRRFLQKIKEVTT